MLERVAARWRSPCRSCSGRAAAPASGDGDVVFRFQDPAIVESSGLVVQRRPVRDHQRLRRQRPGLRRRPGHRRDRRGHHAGRRDPEDVEALAPAGPRRRLGRRHRRQPNERGRRSASTRVPVGAGRPGRRRGTTYELAYPDAAARRRDAARATRGPAGCYVASKSIFGGALYAAPSRARAPDRPEPADASSAAVLPIATDGAFFPDGEHLVLRDYGRAVVYTLPRARGGRRARPARAAAGRGDRRRRRRRGLRELRGTCNAPVLEVTLPDAAARRGRPARPAPEPSASASTPTDAAAAPGRAGSCRRRSRRAAASRGSGCSARRCSSVLSSWCSSRCGRVAPRRR